MRRRRKYDFYLVVFLTILTVGYFTYNHMSAESRGVENYSEALEAYKSSDYEKAYDLQKFRLGLRLSRLLYSGRPDVLRIWIRKNLL